MSAARRPGSLRPLGACLVALLAMLALPGPVRAADVAELLDAWQLEDAMAASATQLARQPGAPAARALAAEVMHQRGLHAHALALLGEGPGQRSPADAIDPARLPRAIGERLEALRPRLHGAAALARGAHHLCTAHFDIAYQDKDEIVAWYAQDVLEAAYERIGAALGGRVAERGERIGVEIYPSARGLSAATGLSMAEIEDSGTIAVCKFHRLMVVSPAATLTGYAWADTLAHELTHLIVSKRSRNTVPIWLHEGIAKYYESAWRGPPGRALTAHAEGLLRRATQAHTLVPFARMHPSMAKLPTQQEAALAFAEVFAMVEHIVQSRGPRAVAQALTQLGAGVPLNDVLVRAFGGTMAQLERRLGEALQRRRWGQATSEDDDTVALQGSGRPAPGAAEAADATRRAEPSPQRAAEDAQVQALMRLGELLMLQGEAVAAVEPLQRAWARSTRRPPQLALRLARALRDAHRPAEAMELLGPAMAAHPELADGQLLLGALHLAAGSPQRALAPLRAYILRIPFNPEAHALWQRALAAVGDAPGAEREGRFAALAAAPRPAPSLAPEATAAPSQNMGRVRILTSPWRRIAIDGAAMPTPLWDWPLQSGPHRVRVLSSGGEPIGTEHTVMAELGDPEPIVLPAYGP